MTDHSSFITFHEPQARVVPVLLDSPHSGAFYPDDFHFSCPKSWLQQTEDAYVDRLFALAPSMGMGFLKAEFARSYIDVNRAENDIDPKIIDGEWHEELEPTERSFAGHGLIRHLCRSQPVYAGKISMANARQRIENCYRPYHEVLESELTSLRDQFGVVWHINCHSMPSGITQPVLAALYPQADFILGDRDGTSCEKPFSRFLTERLEAMGYRVGHNDPYKGVEIINRYGRPREGMHSIQLEVSRALYMDEKTLQPHEGYEALQMNLNRLLEDLRSWAEDQLVPQKLAAE